MAGIDITIPVTAQMVYGDHWAGWTWFTKDMYFKVVRYFYYKEEGRDVYQLVFFTREETYEQFKDDLSYLGELRYAAIGGVRTNLPRTGNDNNRSYGSAQTDT